MTWCAQTFRKVCLCSVIYKGISYNWPWTPPPHLSRPMETDTLENKHHITVHNRPGQTMKAPSPSWNMVRQTVLGPHNRHHLASSTAWCLVSVPGEPDMTDVHLCGISKKGKSWKRRWSGLGEVQRLTKNRLKGALCDGLWCWLHAHIHLPKRKPDHQTKESLYCTLTVYILFFKSLFFFERKGLMQLWMAFVFQSRLELLIPLPQLLECWNYRGVPWCLHSSEWVFWWLNYSSVKT